jgi:sugar phosphate isomerase/epimerase
LALIAAVITSMPLPQIILRKWARAMVSTHHSQAAVEYDMSSITAGSTRDRKMQNQDRRQFLKSAACGTAAALGTNSMAFADRDDSAGSAMKFGLVTYLWGKDMDLATLIDVCEKSGVAGVELRTEHAHAVEPQLSKQQRAEVRKRFADSPVELVGYGSNAQFHESDPKKVKQNIELTKQYIHLMHDCGGSGVKVKPNGFPKDVTREKTIEQIGRSFNQVAKYGAGFGQQIRVEVHGRGTSELPVVRDIFEVADHPNATVCWNSNDVDLDGEGLEHHFDLVKDRFGATVHVRELNVGKYPYSDLMKLFVKMKYKGWILLEARANPKDKVAALIEQRTVFEQMTG